MIYQTDTVRIVPFEKNKHLNDRYRSWFHDPETTKHNSHGLFPYTSAQMDEFMSVIEKGSNNKIIWAIEISKNEQVIGAISPLESTKYSWLHVGNCSLQSINWIYRSAEIAVVIGDAQARGKGVGRQACEWMIEHGFLKLNMNRIWTGTADTNEAMKKTALKLGMKHEVQFRDGMYLHGKHVDVHVYSMLRDDFNKLHGLTSN